jgi:signal transduction histidine kinase
MAEFDDDRDGVTKTSVLSAEDRRQLEQFKALRPFLKRCFSLNHDINNPLAGILGYAEFMLTDGDSLTDEQRSNLDQIIKCAERIKTLIDNLSEAKAELEEQSDIDELSPLP